MISKEDCIALCGLTAEEVDAIAELALGLGLDGIVATNTTLRRAPLVSAAAAIERWAEAQAPAIRQFRAMISRAQARTPVAPAMLAQIASQARNILGR